MKMLERRKQRVVLCVTNQKTLARFVREVVCDMDQKIDLTLTDSGEEAIKLAKNLEPDYVIMDVCLPSLSGVDAARTIRRMDFDCEIIMMTPYQCDDYPIGL